MADMVITAGVDACEDFGKMVRSRKPPPKHPDVFEKDIRAKQFTNGRVDADVVAGLYRKVWNESLALAESFNFNGQDWGDDDMQEFLAVAPYFPRLEKVFLRNNPRISAAAMAQARL